MLSCKKTIHQDSEPIISDTQIGNLLKNTIINIAKRKEVNFLICGVKVNIEFVGE